MSVLTTDFKVNIYFKSFAFKAAVYFRPFLAHGGLKSTREI